MEIVTTGSGQGWQAPQWLRQNTPGHPVNASKEEVLTALGQARRLLEVASEEELLIQLRETLSIFDLPDNWDVQARLYVKSLRDLPPDLLGEALEHVVKTYEYKFPKPATVRKPVEGILSDRHADVKRLEMILKLGKFKEPPMRKKTAQEIAEAQRIIDEVTAKLSHVAP